MTNTNPPGQFGGLGWLADAPLLIDGPQVSAIYDAVVKPEATAGTTVITLTDETRRGLMTAAEVGAEASTGGLLATLLPGLKFSGKASAEHAKEKTSSSEQSLELHPIDNPSRQLIHLTLHYLANQRDRLVLADATSGLGWAEDDFIGRLPRALMFFDLPAETPIVPAALERADGTVTTVFDKLAPEGETLPEYPSWKRDGNPAELAAQRATYWRWFADRYSDTRAMIAVEKAAEGGQGISWVDYRVPVNQEGVTLHLHVQGRQRYDTGTFAYNFVKRGFKHGLRIVGTLKQEPDLNVLAVFEK